MPAVRRRLDNTISFLALHPGQRLIYKGLGRRDLIRAGRRYGKTSLLETAASKWAAKGLRVGWFSPSYKLLSPSYKRILRTIRPMVEHSNKTDGLIELEGGGQVEFWTLTDEDAGRSRWYDKVIIDEASLVKRGLKMIWEASIAPTLLDRGGDCVMAGTPKGIDPENFFYEASEDARTKGPLGFAEWYAPTADNPTLDKAEVALLKSKYPPLVYKQEFLAEFVNWSGDAFFLEASLLGPDGRGVAVPAKVDAIYAIIDSATKTGKEHDGTAVLYCALNVFENRLTILDWDIVQIEGDLLVNWLPGVFAHCEALAKRCNARRGSLGAFIEDKASGMILIQAAQRRGWPARAIDSNLTAVGKDERAISVSGYVFQGQVKMTAEAHEKVTTYKGQTKNHFLSQVTGFRIGLKDQQDDLLDTMTYAAAIGLGNSQGF